jgi:hypothetical protein
MRVRLLVALASVDVEAGAPGGRVGVAFAICRREPYAGDGGGDGAPPPRRGTLSLTRARWR